MGRMKFGSSLQPAPVKTATWPPELLDVNTQDLSVVYTVDAAPAQAPLATMLPSPIEYREVEKIVYIDKPVEVIKYVDREIIKEVEKPVIIEKIVLVEAAALPSEIKEVIVEKIIEKEIVVEKQVTSIASMVTIIILGLALIGAIASGTF